MIASATPDAPDTHGMPVAHVLARHFDPVRGSLFWLRRAAELGIDRPHATLRGLGDLPRLGTLWPHEMRKVPLMDLVPRSLHQSRSNLLVAQTGGTTGPGVWTAWLPEEFTDAFVRPFALAASAAGFPRGGTWLALCPSGPHIIGRAAIAIARATGGMDPFMIDLDPRWIRSLEPGSFVHGRYVAHVLAQAADVLEHQPIDVLFATPPLLLALAERLPESVRRRIRGVHHGGMAMTTEDRRRLQEESFPEAVHLSGYGNTLLGCCLELPGGDRLDHFPLGRRLHLEVRDEAGEPCPDGVRGRVHATRLDESVLLVSLAERDEASLVAPPPDAPAGFELPGLRRPAPLATTRSVATAGLY